MVGTPRVVLNPEMLDDDSRLAEGPESLAIEALVPEAAMGAFHEAVLAGTGRLNIDRPDLLLGQPVLEFLGDKLRTVV